MGNTKSAISKDSENTSNYNQNRWGTRGQNQKQNQKYHFKILMLGTSGCGKSTIAKQIKILNCNGFSAEERKYNKSILIYNLTQSIQELISQAQKFDLKIALADSKVEGITKLDPLEDQLTQSNIEDMQCLWNDEGWLKITKKSQFKPFSFATSFKELTLYRLSQLFKERMPVVMNSMFSLTLSTVFLVQGSSLNHIIK